MNFLTLVLLVSLSFIFDTANALTVDEIIKLKQGGVSDETIQLLIRRDSDDRLSGTWKTKEGSIVQSTEFGHARKTAEADCQKYYPLYPLEIYPQVFPGRRWR
jgi:hypothetical protein